MDAAAMPKVALCQIEVVEGCPSRYEAAFGGALARAEREGADVLIASPASFGDAHLRVEALNGAALSWSGSRGRLDFGRETCSIAVQDDDAPCDILLRADVSPWTLRGGCDVGLQAERGQRNAKMTVTMRPVGMRNAGGTVCVFDGSSRAVADDGSRLAQLRDDFKPDFAIVGAGSQEQKPCGDKLLAALVTAVRSFDTQVLGWGPKWVIGLSGGLDSSVVASLLSLALGPERVVGYNMATHFNSAATRSNAGSLADALGIRMRSGSIEDLVEGTRRTVSSFGYPQDSVSGLVLENVQARVRGHLLSTFAALEGGVIANNGNRVEAALGYATLYGDAIGALAPIGEVSKIELFGLAHALNEQLGVAAVPENLVAHETENGFEWETMPSAELADGQRDPMKWFYHDWLVSKLLDETGGDPCPIMARYLEDRLFGTEAGKWVRYYGLDAPSAFLEDLEWVLRQMRLSAYKRIQSPPVVRVASPASAAGMPERQGTREESGEYASLRARILSA